MNHAPVSGGTHGAAAGTLSVLVGGPAETFAASEGRDREIRTIGPAKAAIAAFAA